MERTGIEPVTSACRSCTPPAGCRRLNLARIGIHRAPLVKRWWSAAS